MKYAGFLTITLAIELAIAASLYTYKDSLAEGLQKGLNQSIRNYGPDYVSYHRIRLNASLQIFTPQVMKSADFDAMQENVSKFLMLFP